MRQNAPNTGGRTSRRRPRFWMRMRAVEAGELYFFQVVMMESREGAHGGSA